MTKLNFIILERFIDLHPELTAKEREEILKLDADFGKQKNLSIQEEPNQPLTSEMVSEVGMHVFDTEEISNFLKSNQIDYAHFQKMDSSDWRFNLARYITTHLQDRFVASAIDSNGFPIPEGEQLLTAENSVPEKTSIAKHNLNLHIEYLRQAFQNAASFDELEEKLANSVFMVERRSSPDECTISLANNDFFWQLIDPLGDGDVERINLLRAFRSANKAIASRGQQISLSPFSMSEKILLKEWANIFLQSYDQQEFLPIPENPGLESWQLDVDQQSSFEDFLGSMEFKSYHNTTIWPPALTQKFIDFFNVASSDIHTTNRLLPMIYNQILEQNGYCLIHIEQTDEYIICRTLEMMTTENQIGPREPDLAIKQNIIIRAEPLNKSEAKKLEDINYSMNYSSMSLLPFAFQSNAISELKKIFPSFREILESLDENYANEAILEFIVELNRSIHSTDLELEDMLNGLPFEGHIALTRSKDPKACLLFLLMWSSMKNSMGNYLRAVLPGYFSTMRFDMQTLHPISHQYGKNKSGIEELEITTVPRALSNNWNIWNGESIQILSDTICKLSNDDLQFILNKNVSKEQLEIHDKIQSFIQEDYIEFGESHPQSNLDTKYKNDALDVDKLLKSLKLHSTKDLILNLSFDKGGTIRMEDVLRLDLTAAERQDLKRGLKKIITKRTAENFQVSSQGNLNQVQFELLPTQTIKAILHDLDDFSSAKNLWSILFARSPQSACHFFEKLLLENTTKLTNSSNYLVLKNGHESQYYSIRNGLEILMQCPLTIAQKLVTKHQNLLIQYLAPEIIQNKIGGPSFIQTLLDEDLTDDRPEESINLLGTIWHTLEQVSDFGYQIDETQLRETLSSSMPLEFVNFLVMIFAHSDQPVNEQIVQNVIELLKLNFSSSHQEKIVRNSGDNFIINVAELIRDHDLKACILDFSQYVDMRLSEGSPVKINYKPVFEILGAYPESLNLSKDSLMIAALNGIDWSWKKLSSTELFTQSEDGTLALTELSDNFIRQMINGTHDLTEIVDFFKKLQTMHGNFSLEKSYTVNRGTYEDILRCIESSFRTDTITMSVSSAFVLRFYLTFTYDIRSRPESYHDLILSFRQKYNDNKILFENEAAQATFESTIFPERNITEKLQSLSELDRLPLPESIIHEDRITQSYDEAFELQQQIIEQYSFFAKQIELHIMFSQIGINDALSLPALESDTLQTPLVKYANLLTLGATGDPSALNELWRYDTGEIKLESKIRGFSKSCLVLLQTGRFVLLNKCPEKFFRSHLTGSIRDDHPMGMIEFANPNASIPGLNNHWDNPTSETQDSDYNDSINHASMVFQTLVGNADLLRADGKVRSYNLDHQTDNFFTALDTILEEVLQDIKSGKEISVLNLSFGAMQKNSFIGSSFGTKKLNATETLSLRKKFDQLQKLNIPVCIAAGNDGQMAFNMLAHIDPSLIVVGSTKLNGIENEDNQNLESRISTYLLSNFSSIGSATAHADVLALGEGYNFATNFGGEADISGTSFASPLTARLIAQMRELNPKLSVEKIQTILKMTASDLSANTPTEEGAGQIVPEHALYIAYAMNERDEQKRYELAEKLGVTNQSSNLDQLTKWIRRLTSYHDTTKQGFGE